MLHWGAGVPSPAHPAVAAAVPRVEVKLCGVMQWRLVTPGCPWRAVTRWPHPAPAASAAAFASVSALAACVNFAGWRLCAWHGSWRWCRGLRGLCVVNGGLRCCCRWCQRCRLQGATCCYQRLAAAGQGGEARVVWLLAIGADDGAGGVFDDDVGACETLTWGQLGVPAQRQSGWTGHTSLRRQ